MTLLIVFKVCVCVCSCQLVREWFSKPCLMYGQGHKCDHQLQLLIIALIVYRVSWFLVWFHRRKMQPWYHHFYEYSSVSIWNSLRMKMLILHKCGSFFRYTYNDYKSSLRTIFYAKLHDTCYVYKSYCLKYIFFRKIPYVFSWKQT